MTRHLPLTACRLATASHAALVRFTGILPRACHQSLRAPHPVRESERAGWSQFLPLSDRGVESTIGGGTFPQEP